MNDDDTALQERLYWAVCPPEWDAPAETRHEQMARSMHREMTLPMIAALMPTVHAEVKRAQAQAWDEGNLAGMRDQANWDGWRYPRGYQEHLNPYRETEQGNA